MRRVTFICRKAAPNRELKVAYNEDQISSDFIKKNVIGEEAMHSTNGRP